MTILSAQSIRNLQIVSPMEPRTEYRGRTFGLSACGYDVRVEFDSVGREYLKVLQPGEFLLASTIEQFDMPKDVVGRVCDKSSWARLGLSVFNTVIEPGWKGYLTVEIINNGPNPIHMYRGDPIAQVLFELLDEPTESPYTGKYQYQQRGPQRAR